MAIIADRLATWIDGHGVPEGEPPERTLGRRIGVGAIVAGIPTYLLGALATWASGQPRGLSIALFLGSIASVALLLLYRKTRRVETVVVLQIVFSTIGNAVQIWVVGGFQNSGAAPIWGLMGPIVALIAVGPRVALAAFVAFAGVVVFSLLLPFAISVPPTDPVQTAISNGMNVLLLSSLVFSLMLWFVIERERALRELAAERLRSDQLLANVLPELIAHRLKAGDGIADHVPEAGILFADLVGFTSMSSNLLPSQVVATLDALFIEFDALVDRYQLEKIKTIGDCYMVASGVPTGGDDHLDRLGRLAIDLREAVRKRAFAGRTLDVRIGMHTGPVIAGVIGKKRFLYDLWGDTVNTASRMESSGLPGEIQVTEAMRDRLGPGFVFEERGTVDVKGKGEMRTWVLRSLSGSCTSENHEMCDQTSTGNQRTGGTRAILGRNPGSSTHGLPDQSAWT